MRHGRGVARTRVERVAIIGRVAGWSQYFHEVGRRGVALGGRCRWTLEVLN